MKRTFTMSGLDYSRNKNKVKNVFRTHGLRWVGTLEAPCWASQTEKVEGYFEREDGITTQAILIWYGAGETPLLLELTEELTPIVVDMQDEFDGKKDASEDDVEREIAERMYIWDICNKPNVDEMRKARPGRPPAPERFIELAIEDYEKKRKEKVKEVRAEVEKELGVKPKKRDQQTLAERFGNGPSF